MPTRTTASADERAVSMHFPGAGLTITGPSVAGVETCIMVPELGIMIDVGMCPPGSMDYSKILLTHCHADHAGCLYYMLAGRDMMHLPVADVYVPVGSHTLLLDLIRASCNLDGSPSPTARIIPTYTEPADQTTIVYLGQRGKTVYSAVPIQSRHRIPSVAWSVMASTHLLKAEHRGKPGPELAALRKSGVVLEEIVTRRLLTVTGDTTIDMLAEHPELLDSEVLCIECTRYDSDDKAAENTRRWGHIHVSDLAPYWHRFTGEAMVLMHRSVRNTLDQAKAALRELGAPPSVVIYANYGA